jgi:cytochrome c-type biogenesis protein CcmH/NrfF
LRLIYIILPTVIVIVLCGFLEKGLSLQKGYVAPFDELQSESFEASLNEAQTIQYQRLVQKLRCVVCYNQSLSESQAPMAMDIKAGLKRKIAAGESESEILSFMTARYGEFIVYDPPYRLSTALLWGGPLLLLTGLVWVLHRQFRCPAG